MITRISTIHFANVHANRNPVGLGNFSLPAVPNGEQPFVYELTDRIQRERGPYGDSITQVRPTITHQVRSLEIAMDLVAEWTERGQLMDTEAHPGIWVVRDYLPELGESGVVKLDADGHTIWREASAEEKKSMWDEDLATAKAADKIYAMRLFDYWSAKTRDKPEMRQFISKVCKLGAAHYGFKAPWLNEALTTQTELCPYCKSTLPNGVLKCPHCNEVVDPEGYAKERAKTTSALEAELAKSVGSVSVLKPLLPPVRPPQTKQ